MPDYLNMTHLPEALERALLRVPPRRLAEACGWALASDPYTSIQRLAVAKTEKDLWRLAKGAGERRSKGSRLRACLSATLVVATAVGSACEPALLPPTRKPGCAATPPPGRPAAPGRPRPGPWQQAGPGSDPPGCAAGGLGWTSARGSGGSPPARAAPSRSSPPEEARGCRRASSSAWVCRGVRGCAGRRLQAPAAACSLGCGPAVAAHRKPHCQPPTGTRPYLSRTLPGCMGVPGSEAARLGARLPSRDITSRTLCSPLAA